MEETVERIIRIENEAKNLAKDSSDRAKDLDTSVKNEIGELEKKTKERAEKRLEKVQAFESAEAEKLIGETEKKRNEAIERLNKIYAEKKDEWVNMIVDSVIGEK